MKENPFAGQKNEDASPEKDYLKNPGGIAGQLERIYNSLVMTDVIRQPEFADAATLISDFQDIVKHDDGSPLAVSEAVRALRIIAKEQGWNGDTWNWDIIRKEAGGMKYRVRPPKTSEEWREAA